MLANIQKDITVTNSIIHFQKVLIYQFTLNIHQCNLNTLVYACLVLHFPITHILEQFHKD